MAGAATSPRAGGAGSPPGSAGSRSPHEGDVAVSQGGAGPLGAGPRGLHAFLMDKPQAPPVTSGPVLLTPGESVARHFPRRLRCGARNMP